MTDKDDAYGIYRWPFAVFVVIVATAVAYAIEYIKTLL